MKGCPIQIAIGSRYGRLIVMSRASTPPGLGQHCSCRCDCGAMAVVRAADLKRGTTRSCGCLQIDARYTHGRYASGEYRSWYAMKQRCLNPRSTAYSYYGERGITLDPAWQAFEAFFKDMGPRPTSNHSLERLDNNGPYNKQNCCWALRYQQSRNTRRNRWITFNDRTMVLEDWAKNVGLTSDTILRRFNRGWSIERALTIPSRRGPVTRTQ